MKPILFTNVSIFDGSGSGLYPGEVCVKGNRIAAVAKGNNQIDRENVELVDGKGRTLMPGLVEAHAHLTWPSSVERVVNTMKLPLEEHLLVTAQNARITLDHGFTSAYSAGSLGERFEVALRDAIDRGALPGPRLRASALEKGAEGVMGVPEGHDPTHDRDLNGLRKYVAEMKTLGCDTIKFLLSSDEGFAPGGSQVLMYSEEETRAIGEEAREQGVWLACHAQAAEAVKQACRAGFRAIYHCTYADEEALDMLEARKNEVFTAPAPGLLYARVHEAGAFGIGLAEATRMGAVSGLELMAEVYPKMRKRGIRVLPGGDYGFPYNPVGRNARDLKIFVDLLGFSAVDVLVAATRHGGELMAMDVGEIRAGKLADILLIDGDPTVDVTILEDKNRMPVVMKDGLFYRNML
ncbi:Imidazolonepropionase [Sphingobium sp. AP50]|jgi:imidazolonepropionase-like amidohydrolase|uniref:amidohydrolase family protein n=1 Tax=unclassified Sphingobium TaxID=2611147 RepID=UPI00083DE779|nr:MULTISPECIES: amidohydrolase family protein [unclassified Sphingobium]AOF97903.1 amidohydrolase family protein [Sphingobium sp. RAC03]SEJ48627.1 Imidazolonepropionase [Sphingobium sp. AP50]